MSLIEEYARVVAIHGFSVYLSSVTQNRGRYLNSLRFQFPIDVNEIVVLEHIDNEVRVVRKASEEEIKGVNNNR